jgi:hydrogenase maturation protease
MTTPRVLVAGVGNIFLGDDAFGVEVVQRLAGRGLADGVRVVDIGIRGLDLAYALLDGYEAVVLVDATPRGGPPGTLYVIEVDTGNDPEAAGEGALIETHGMDPVKVLRLARAMGGPVERLFVVGCEPEPPGESDDMRAGLSEPVRAAVGDAVVLVESLVARLLERGPINATGTQITPGEEVETCPN